MALEQRPADEVWAQEMAMRECIKAGDLEGYLSFWHADVMDWPKSQAVPITKDGVRQLVSGISGKRQIVSMTSEVKRLSVHVVGDTGIAFYETHMRATLQTGEEIENHERVFHTWKRTDEGWRVIGGMSAPVTEPQG
jgi:ketosteroid isomerase-like protein